MNFRLVVYLQYMKGNRFQILYCVHIYIHIKINTQLIENLLDLNLNYRNSRII